MCTVIDWSNFKERKKQKKKMFHCNNYFKKSKKFDGQQWKSLKINPKQNH